MANLVASFYKYVEIADPIKLRNEQLEVCESLSLKGRILIGSEGINGSVFGAQENIEKYKRELRKKPLFSDLDFKEQEAQKQAFSRLYISVRKEIVHLGIEVNLKNTGKFLTPKELKEWLDGGEDVILLDMRNDYESKIGKFRNAVTLETKNFRDLPNATDKIHN